MANSGGTTQGSGITRVTSRQRTCLTLLPDRLIKECRSALTLGIAARLFSLPDGAEVSVTELSRNVTEGDVAVARCLRELERLGFLRRRVVRGPDGTAGVRTLLFDVPDPDPEPDPGGTARTALPPAPSSDSGTGVAVLRSHYWGQDSVVDTATAALSNAVSTDAAARSSA